MADKDFVSKYRAEVIERTINIETIMNAIISQQYLKRVDENFLLEVLLDEYFSFALKRRIIEKIINDIDKQQFQNLNRINTIRNYFAHCGQEMFKGDIPPPPGEHGYVPDPRKPDRAIDFQKIYDEFMSIIDELEKYLAHTYLKMGGKLFKNIDGKLVEERFD